MLLGYHVDSNLSRRMLLHRGSIESLEERVAGYHCNHNREPTVYHGAGKVANDLVRFFVVGRARRPARAARRRGAFPTSSSRRCRFASGAGRLSPTRLTAVLPDDAGPRAPSHAARVPFRVHVRLRPRPAVRRRLARGLAARRGRRLPGGQPASSRRCSRSSVERLGFRAPAPASRAFDDHTSVERARADGRRPRRRPRCRRLARRRPRTSTADDDRPAQFPPTLDRALDALDRLVELEREPPRGRTSTRGGSSSSTAGPSSGTRTCSRTSTAATRRLTRASGARPSGSSRSRTTRRGLRSSARGG